MVKKLELICIFVFRHFLCHIAANMWLRISLKYIKEVWKGMFIYGHAVVMFTCELI